MQGRTEPPGCLALSRWARWSAGQLMATSNAAKAVIASDKVTKRRRGKDGLEHGMQLRDPV